MPHISMERRTLKYNVAVETLLWIRGERCVGIKAGTSNLKLMTLLLSPWGEVNVALGPTPTIDSS